jgi:hypothetical protein
MNLTSNCPQILVEARAKAIVVSLAFLALVGCAALERSPEAAVEVRARERWEALLAKRFDEAYEFHTDRIRKAQDFNKFRGRFGAEMSIKSAKVVLVECKSEASCLARIRIETGLALPNVRTRTIETHVDEPWVKQTNGQWLIDASS